MAIAVKCPGCQSSYRVAPERIGSSATCQSCGQRFTLSMVADETLGGASLAVKVAASADTAEGGLSAAAAVAASRAGASTPDQPRVRIGRYEIRELLGAGAFGTVYRAHDPDLDRDVALKVPRAGALDAPGARERFLREARAAARLHHPNIVPIHDVGQDGGGVFIVAAFIEGQTLAAGLTSAQVDRARGVEIAAKLADALHAAHQAGIVHRDVKPANVMLDRRGEPQLMDFGLAQLATASAQLTQQCALMGTPCYMSPEQALGEQSRIGPASDQYSLGVLLYEVLCGRLPFEGPPLAVLYQVREKTPDAPRSIDPSIPPALEAICLRAMAKRPEDRFADCAQLAQALRHAAVESRPAGRASIAMGRSEPPRSSAPAAPTIAQATVANLGLTERWKRLDLKRRVAIEMGLLGCILLLGVIIIVKTLDGDVRVETDNPNAVVTIDGPTITIATPPATNTSGSPSNAATHSTSAEQATADGLPPPAPAIAPFDAEQAFSGTTAGQQRDDNGLKLKLRWCPPGEFIMGSTRLYSDTVNNEKPAVRVTLTHGFWLGEHEVTQDQWRQVMGTTPWSGQDSVREGTDFPATYIDGNMSVEFCKRLTETEREAGRLPGDWRYALPTEAQWEYACRAGTDTLYHFGDAAASLGEYAWYEDNTVRNQESFAHQVGRKRPNAWGLHDMAGNVFEWCADWYADQTYARHPDGNAIDPSGAPLGTKRTIRGGAWQFNAGICRAARRMGVEATSSGPNSGFRVACVPTAP